MLLPFVFRAALIGLMRSNPARLASRRNAQNQPAPDSPGVPQIQPCEACVETECPKPARPGVPQIQPCEACSGRNAQNTPKTSPPQTALGASDPTLRGLLGTECSKHSQNQPAPDSPGVSQIQPCEACVGRFALPVPTEGNCLSPQSGRVCPNGDEKGVRTEQQTQPVDLRHTGLYEGGRKYSE